MKIFFQNLQEKDNSELIPTEKINTQNTKKIPVEINTIKEEEKINTQENSNNNIRLNSLAPEILLTEKRKPEESSFKNKNNSQFLLNRKKNNFLNLENIGDSFLLEKNSTKNLENSIREKYDLDLKSYLQLDKNFYTQLIKEEENYMEDIITRISDFSKQKNFPEFYSNTKQKECSNINNKSNDKFFFVVNNDKDDGVCNYLKNVPYHCPFPACKRKFFNLKNLEKHTH